MPTDAPRIDGRTSRHAHVRGDLLDRVVEHLLEHGIAQASLRPLAQGIGVSHTTLLRHFGTKEALIVEVIDRIRTELLATVRASSSHLDGVGVADSMRLTWAWLCQPSERRQFAFLFEVVGLHARNPERFGSLAPSLVTDFIGPIQGRLVEQGLTADQARDLATGFVAQVRGLQLDLAVSGDLERVDAAMEAYIIAATAQLPARVGAGGGSFDRAGEPRHTDDAPPESR